MNILTKATVLVLNRNWQAINVRTPQEAFCMLATNVATGLEIEGEDQIRPVTWEDWIDLPIRDQDEAVHTVRGQIRVPSRLRLQRLRQFCGRGVAVMHLAATLVYSVRNTAEE
jgi:hypothetical protein